MEAIDWSGDSMVDLAVSNAFLSRLQVMRGNGDGSFALTGAVANLASRRAWIDLDDDGKLDVVGLRQDVTLEETRVVVAYARDFGPGTISFPDTLTTLKTNSGLVAVADLLGDGTKEMIISTRNWGDADPMSTLSIHPLLDFDQTLATIEIPEHIRAIQIGDVDGRPGQDIAMMVQDCAGSFVGFCQRWD